MSTTEEHLPEITTACPTWCTHEFADSPGALEYDIHLCSDNEADPIMTRDELIQLSRDALAAAA